MGDNEQESQPACLHNSLCKIENTEGKGRGLFGSLFNHSECPNVSFSLDPTTETIRFTTARLVKPGEELCIFYGSHLWFRPAGELADQNLTESCLNQETDDYWDSLRAIMDDRNPFSSGNPADIVPEADLPFLRTKVTPEYEDEDEENSVRTMKVWVADIPDPKMTSSLLKWVKDACLETPDLVHLKRVRRRGSISALLLTGSASPPSIPATLALSQLYQTDVPETVASTPKSFKLKMQIWPTVYAPKRKGEPEPWSRAKAAWAWDAVKTLRAEAKRIAACGELPIISYVPRSFAEEGRELFESSMPSFLAHDTRLSTARPLLHSVINVVRRLADWRALSALLNGKSRPSLSERTSPDLSEASDSFLGALDVSMTPTETPKMNGAHYLLTSLTLFTTHEPCLMCSFWRAGWPTALRGHDAPRTEREAAPHARQLSGLMDNLFDSLLPNVWLGVRAAFNENSWIQRQRRRLLVALFFAPYIVFIGFSVWSLVIVLQHPELIERNGAYYCTINYNPLIYAVPGFAAGIIVIMLLLEILIGVALIRRWKALHRTPRLSASALSMIARIAVFSVYGFATLGACAAFLARSLNIWPFLVQASLPTAIFLVFGNRLDVWRTWLFWRRHGEEDRDAHSVAICVTLDTTIEGEGERGVERASDLENEREHAEVQKEKLPELDEVRSEV
ncbi:hypothetical protein EW145_g1933 [Phellinidium pouzarii]|uniref:SET domain-containing protein n=1 Tax=Phellinidium pouzarii TaxID=167371 RepID=A0A4S4LEH7_9AGAM|nr:hypothetical protein EW145_g1933 [Phellinidium pouzarii]